MLYASPPRLFSSSPLVLDTQFRQRIDRLNKIKRESLRRLYNSIDAIRLELVAKDRKIAALKARLHILEARLQPVRRRRIKTEEESS